MSDVDERIAHLEELLATPRADRDEDTLRRTLRNLRQLRTEMTLQ